MHRNSPSCPGFVESGPGARRKGDRGASALFLQPVRPGGGFTLLELMIVIALISVILVVGIVSGTSSSDRRKFEYAVDRMATTLRMARVEAINSGRRVQLTFDEETRLPAVFWEPAPLSEPGQFEPHTTCLWLSRVPRNRIAVTRCRATGPDGLPIEAAPTSIGDDTDSEDMQTITFNPDGTSDSVLIELESADLGDTLRAAIKLDGENNIITTRILFGQAEDDEEDPFADEETENSE
jgi:prepilin-type N-terminal cleavage/methylation domain-containing protein